jgi:hypothetical protein
VPGIEAKLVWTLLGAFLPRDVNNIVRPLLVILTFLIRY